jgi:hypothetical protein
MIHVGTAGPANLVNHKPVCKGRPKKIQKISDMFPSVPKPRAPFVPSTVTVAVSSYSAPVPLIPSTSTAASGNENDEKDAASALRQSSPGADLTLVGSDHDGSSFLDCGASDASHGLLELNDTRTVRS